jgi:hypothetical protein
MRHSAELRARLEAEITALESDLGRLRAALAALDGHEAPVPRQPVSRQPRRRAARRRARRSAEPSAATPVVPEGALTKLLGNSDGLSTAQLAQQSSGAPDQVLRLLKQLERSGRAHRTGNRRSTRWHAGRAPARSR